MDGLVIHLQNDRSKGRWRFDFSNFLICFPHDLLENLCKDLRNTHEEYVKHQITFRDGYLTPAYDFLLSYVSNFRERDVNEDTWSEFFIYQAQQIQIEKEAIKTKEKWLLYLSTFSKTLFRIGALPEQIKILEVEALNSRKPHGSGSKPKEKKIVIDQYQGPFAFRIEGHYRPYDFRDYIFLGDDFIKSTIENFRLYISSKLEGRTCHKSIRSLYLFLVDKKRNTEHPDFFKKLDSLDYKNIDAFTWENLLVEWRASLKTKCDTSGGNLSCAHIKIIEIERFFNFCHTKNCGPSVRITGFKNAKKRSNLAGRRRNSLIELSASSSKKIDESKAELINKIIVNLPPDERAEAKKTIESLVLDLDDDEVKTISPAQVIEKLIRENSVRLNEIRELAEVEFTHWFEHWTIGQQALSEAKKRFKPNELVELLDGMHLTTQHKKSNSSRYLYCENDSERLGNFLLYIVEALNGQTTGLSGRIHHVARSFDGSELCDPLDGQLRDAIQAYLYPHHRAVTALWILLLVETGANTEVVRDSIYECCQATNDINEVKIVFSNKERAKGKPIVDTISIDSFVYEAIQNFKLMSKFMRETCELTDELKEKLFLCWGKATTKCSAITEFNARDWFKQIISQSDYLNSLNVVPSNIRPSVLMDVQFTNEGHIAAAQAMADHSNTATTDVYTGRAPIRMLYNLKIQEFQRRFQSVIIVTIDGAAEKLGLTAEQFKTILSDAYRTGLGVACLDPFAGVQPESKKGEICTCVENCHSCEKSWFVATENNVVDVILFNRYLKNAEKDSVITHTEKWATRWFPWLIYSNVVIEKIQNSDAAFIYKKALKAAETKWPTYIPIPLV